MIAIPNSFALRQFSNRSSLLHIPAFETSPSVGCLQRRGFTHTRYRVAFSPSCFISAVSS